MTALRQRPTEFHSHHPHLHRTTWLHQHTTRLSISIELQLATDTHWKQHLQSIRFPYFKQTISFNRKMLKKYFWVFFCRRLTTPRRRERPFGLSTILRRNISLETYRLTQDSLWILIWQSPLSTISFTLWNVPKKATTQWYIYPSQSTVEKKRQEREKEGKRTKKKAIYYIVLGNETKRHHCHHWYHTKYSHVDHHGHQRLEHLSRRRRNIEKPFPSSHTHTLKKETLGWTDDVLFYYYYYFTQEEEDEENRDALNDVISLRYIYIFSSGGQEKIPNGRKSQKDSKKRDR